MSDQFVDPVLPRAAVLHRRPGDDHRPLVFAVRSEQVGDGHARRLLGDGRVQNHEAEVGLRQGDEDTADLARVRHDKLVIKLCASGRKLLRSQKTVGN